MTEQLNDPKAQLDVEGFGANEAIEDYVTPGCSTEVELWDCNSGRSAIYWRVTPADLPEPAIEEDAYKYVQYWMYYRVNSFSDAIDEPWSRHEGDWEAVAIAPSRTRPGAFDFASFSQHGHWYSYLRENLFCWQYPLSQNCGTEEVKSVGRPLEVFVANGSHANYGVRCSETVEFVSCGQNASELPERGHDGAISWSHNSSGPNGLAPIPTAPGTWTYWLGQWGASESSPASPGWQPMFSQSWERCADDDEGCPSPETSPRSALGLQHVARGRMIKGPFAKACEDWFGGDVSALLCAPGTLANSVDLSRLGARGKVDLTIVRHDRDSRQRQVTTPLDPSASAPGLSQAVGPPLRPGDTMKLVAPHSQRWSLRVRTVIDDRLVEARFGRVQSGSARLAVSDGLPILRLRDSKLAPDAIRVGPSISPSGIVDVGQ